MEKFREHYRSEPSAVADGLTQATDKLDKSKNHNVKLQPPATAGGSDTLSSELADGLTSASNNADESEFRNDKLQPPAHAGGSDPDAISKEHIFHYVYAVLHDPTYRAKYELNLKRDFPRIPFYENFWKWAEMGKELMDLHINYEQTEKYALERKDVETENPKPKLKADKENGVIYLDSQTSLHNIPESAWEYKLGNRSALEWILDQYKEKKPKDQTIAEKFNSYKFADYKEQTIELLQRVCTVSVKTMEIVQEMEVIPQ